MALNITSVALTAEQKTTALGKTNTAERISSIVASLIANTDAGFGEVSAQVETRITELKAGLGTNFGVADIAARDALPSLSMGDTAFVQDDGDGKWAKYEVSSVAGGTTGSTVTWTKLLDQDMLVDVNVNDAMEQLQANIDANSAAIAALTISHDPSVSSNLGSDQDWNLV